MNKNVFIIGIVILVILSIVLIGFIIYAYIAKKRYNHGICPLCDGELLPNKYYHNICDCNKCPYSVYVPFYAGKYYNKKEKQNGK